MKLPREISGKELSNILHGKHHITIPAHKYLKIGTLSSILSDIAIHFKIDKSDLIKELF